MSNVKIASQNVKWKNPRLWIGTVLISYIFLQVITLKTRSFDGDEGVVLRVVQAGSWREFWQGIAQDVHPPLYHLLAKVSTSLFGIHEWSLRLPSAVAGGLLILLGYWLGKKIWADNRWKPLVLGIVLGFSPYLFYYYQEARFYPLLLLGAVLTYGALLDMDKGKKMLLSVSIFTFGALVMVYCQHLGWFVLASELLCIAIFRKWKVVLWSLPIIAVVVLLYLPIISTTFMQFSGRLSEQGGLMLASNIKGIIGALYRFGAGRLVLGIEPEMILKSGLINIVLFTISVIIPLVLVVAGYCSSLSRTSPTKRSAFESKNIYWNVLAITLTLVSLVVALFVSEIGGRATRYFIYLWPFYGVLIVDGAWKVYRATAGKIVIILFVLVSILALGKHIAIENHAVGARDIAKLFNSSAQPSDVVLVKGALAGGEETALRFYLDHGINIVDYYASYKPGSLSQEQVPVGAIIAKLFRQYSTVWYYDMTYGIINLDTLDITPQSTRLGVDKEGKKMTVYRIIRM